MVTESGIGDVRLGDTRDRVIRVETEVRALDDKLTDCLTKVNEMHDIIMQAKGARWLLLATAGLIGFCASLITKVLPFWPKM